MHRITLRFRDPAVEAAFARDIAAKSVRTSRWVSAAMLGLTVFAAASLRRLIPESSLILGSIALPLGAAWACILAATWLRIFLDRQQLVLAVMVAVGTAVLLNALTHYPPDRLAMAGYFVPAVHVLCVYALFGLRLPIAVAMAWCFTAAYIVLVVHYFDLAGIALARHQMAMAFANCVGMVLAWRLETATRGAYIAQREAEYERGRSESLLLNVLPGPIAQQLKEDARTIADAHDGVTVLFAAIAGFTTWSAQRGPEAVVQFLDRMFSAFDELARRHGLEKIKTIGDCYMAAAGLPLPRPDHAPAALAMARDMLSAAQALARETREPLQLRIGLSSGPVVAGVIGRSKFIYDLWGDTVNTASRMESHGLPGRIQCSESTARLLDGALLRAREEIEVRGKGKMRVFLVDV